MSSELYEVSLLGLSVERARIEAATFNIANMNVMASSPADVMRMKQVDFSRLLTTNQVEITEYQDAQSKYLPEHQLADENGFVYLPKVSLASEMLQLNMATRAYEANVRAFNATKQMNSKALEIGK